MRLRVSSRTKRMNVSKMNLSNVTSTLLILASFFCVHSAPAKPLNERSTELTWQAWLLVDDQQNKQYEGGDGALRRRITPKSIFIAPTFSPEALPACADGYTSDSMGRCIKIIQIDEDAHLDFILGRLKEQFGSIDEDYDEYDLDENLPTPGPMQFNIPLDQKDENENGDSGVAIVVAPTNGSFNLTDGFKVKKNENKTQIDAPTIVTKIQIEDEIKDETTETTTIEVTTETETESPTTIEDIGTTEIINDPDQTAIFFKVPEDVNPETTQNLIRFPENYEESTQQIINQLMPHANLNLDFVTDRKVFHNRDTHHQSTESNFDLNPTTNKIFNHRNRDKHWHFDPQKPVVLRFQNIPNHKPHAFKPPEHQTLYREVPEDLSYLFGKRSLTFTHR